MGPGDKPVNHRGIHCGVAALLVACSFDSTGGSGESASTTSGDTTGMDDDGADDAPGTTSNGSMSGSESDTGPTTDADSTSTAGATTDDGGDSSGEPDPCSVDNGGCDEDAECSVDDDGEVECECPDGFDGDGQECTVVPALEILRWELACGTDLGDTCTSDTSATDSAVLVAEPGLYDVELRIRGVLEQKAYIGGVEDGVWYSGGDPLPDAGWNSTELTISDPAQVYRYNNGPSSVWEVVEVDITRSVKMTAGATITISVSNDNALMIDNDAGIVVDDIEPAPQAFDGQFAQLDAVSITR